MITGCAAAVLRPASAACYLHDMSYTLIGGRVLDPVSGVDQVANISVDGDGRVSAIGGQRVGKVIDISGALGAAWLVDLGTFAGESGGDGSDGLAATAQAALAGGYDAFAGCRWPPGHRALINPRWCNRCACALPTSQYRWK